MLIHTSDLHIGAFSGRQLFNATIDAFEKIVSYAIENNAEAVIVSGDFFERPRLENYSALIRVNRLLKELRDHNIPVVIVPGSHDASVRRQDILSVLEAAGLIHITPYEIRGDIIWLKPLHVGEYVFYGLPGLKNSQEIIFLENNKLVFEDLNKDKTNILLAHTSVEFQGYRFSDFAYRYGKAVVKNERVLRAIPEEIKYIALGHIHFPIPLEDSFIGNIAYPGAPVGRDLSDLLETWMLRNRYSKNRRFLEVVFGEGKPLVKSIWEDFDIDVSFYETEYYPNIDEILSVIKSKLRDLNGKYKVLIVSIHDLPPEKKGDILAGIRVYEQKYNTLIHLSAKIKVEEITDLVLSTYEITDNIEEIERRAVAEAVEKLGLGIEPEKILKLINILGEEKPPEEKDAEYYAKLFNEIKPLLEEILGGR